MAKEQEEIKEEEKQINDFSSNPPLTQQEFDFISKDQPITKEKKRELTQKVASPILKKAEKRMTGEDGVATLKPTDNDKTVFPTTLPKHGVRGLYTDSEKILERAAQITNLPPESPFTQTIAQQLAKGDPFSSQAMEKAKEETMKLVRAGVIPNPYYEGFTGKITQAYETVAPLALEIGLPVTQAIVTAPMLVSPVPGSRVAYFGGLGATSGVANLWAQQMRIGYGHQDETSYIEAAATVPFGMIPGVSVGKNLPKLIKVLVGGVEGAVMAGGENATRQGLEILYGKKGEFSVGELSLTSATGAGLTILLKRIGDALTKYEPKEQAAPLLRKAIKDELAGAKKEVSRLRKQGQRKGLKVHEDKIAKLEEQLNALREPEDKILQNTIDKLEEFEKQQVEAIELYAGEWKQSKAAEVLRESDVPPKTGDISALSPISSTDPDPILTGIKPEQSNRIREDVLLNKVFPRTQGTNQVTAREALQDVLEIAPDTSLSPVIKKLLALKEDTGIDVQIEEKSLASLSPQQLKGAPAKFPGAFIPGTEAANARIIIDGSVTYPLHVLVHESIHAVTAPNINKFFDTNSFRTLKTDEERALFLDGVIKDKNIPKDIKELFSIFKKADSMREEVADKLKKEPKFLGTHRYYWARDPHEFLTAVYSETALQNALKEVKYSPNMSMWDKIVDFVSKKIGLKGKANVNLVERAISTIDNITKMKVPSIEGKAVQAAPTLENIQKDIDRARKFHGSGERFEKFLNEKIGTGNGLAFYGYGTYFAGKKSEAERFRKQLSEQKTQEFLSSLKTGDVDNSHPDWDTKWKDYLKETEEKLSALKVKKQEEDKQDLLEGWGSGRMRGETPLDKDIEAAEKAHAKRIKEYDKDFQEKVVKPGLVQTRGALYEVTLKPKDSEFFDLSKTLDDQHPDVRDKIKKLAEDLNYKPFSEQSDGLMFLRFLEEKFSKPLEVGGGKKEASDKLKEYGIPGNKAGDDVYVIFEAADIDINTVNFAREILNDFKNGGGKREVDPKTGKILDGDDEIKARLLTGDPEKQRLINSVQDAIKQDLENVKGGREGKVQYLAKVQRELDRRLGTDMGEEFALVLKAAQLGDNIEVADAINDLSVQMAANGAVMVKGFDDLLKSIREKNFDNSEELNDAMTSIYRLVPQMLGWKKTGSAAGRLLQSRKYTKDQLEVKIEGLEAQMEENLVDNLKASKDLTPEELDKQIKTFGELEAVKRLLKAVQQANDISEVKDILIKQQQAFQNKTTLRKNFEKGTNLYTKVRDVGADLLYSSMLSAPTTLIKVGLGNAVMSRYNSWMGMVGSKYMAIAPWARRGMTKQQFDEAYEFWSKVGSTYGEFNDIAFQEAKKAFKSGISDLKSHFERIGESALSMERTGLTGALGQSVENLGQFIDIPGKAMSALDARSRMRVAHAMTKAKANYDWRMAKLNGEEVPQNFDDYYKGFLNKVFTEDGTRLMTEDQVRRQAVLNAEKEGVKPEDMASYIDNYVKNNWDTSTSNFVDYVQRNVKEITFTEELGEFNNINAVEAGTQKLESILNGFPLLKTIINPFQRTGRNIIREGLSTTSALADVPGLKKFSDKIWAKTTQDLNSNDPIIAARAKGRQIIGAGIIATAWGMAESGLYEGMTGQNWKKRENVKIGTGLADYQLRIPNGKGGFIGQDINALEPFATVMNIVADVHTLSKGSMSHKKEAMNALNILQLVIANNIGNKSYFKNLGDAIELITLTSESEEAIDAKRARLLKGVFSPAVPSGMNAMSMATDDFRRRSDSILKALAKRIGGIAKEVPPYRDMFGDPQPLHKTDTLKAFSLINPFQVSKQVMDVEDYVVTDKFGNRSFDKKKFKSINLKNKEEVRNAAWAVALELNGEYHFNGGTTIKDGVDLQEIIHPETRIDAFEAWQKEYQTIKLSGLNVKQAVVAFAKQLTTPTKLDPNKAPEGFKQEDIRLKKINQLLGKFREAAYKKIKLQYPVLIEQEKEDKIRNALLNISPNKEQLERITSEMPVEEYKKTQPKTRLQELIGKTPYGVVTE